MCVRSRTGTSNFYAWLSVAVELPNELIKCLQMPCGKLPGHITSEAQVKMIWTPWLPNWNPHFSGGSQVYSMKSLQCGLHHFHVLLLGRCPTPIAQPSMLGSIAGAGLWTPPMVPVTGNHPEMTWLPTHTIAYLLQPEVQTCTYTQVVQEFGSPNPADVLVVPQKIVMCIV